MKNKSYKKILALTLAATLVGGNAVATFATESTTNTGVTAETNSKKEVKAQKMVTATFNAPAGATLEKADVNGGEYVDDTHTAIKFTATSNNQKFNLPTVKTQEGYEFTGWTSDTNAGPVTLDAGATEIQGLIDYGFFYQDETTGYVTFTGTSKKAETVQKTVVATFNAPAGATLEKADVNGGEYVDDTHTAI